MAEPRSPDTATLLLDAAQAMVQERGYNAFSYKDLAATVGIRTASIHYHFPVKVDLGQALMDRYLAGLDQALHKIETTTTDHIGRLKKFIGLYRKTESNRAICLCGSLASDQATLPINLQRAVGLYLERSETWVAKQLTTGAKDQEFSIVGRSRDLARTLIAGLQGGLLLSRATDKKAIDSVQRSFLSCLLPT